MTNQQINNLTMKYVFFGGQDSLFATIILNELTNAGMPPVASIRDAKAPLDLEYLKSLNADFFLVAAFGKILKKDLLDIPPKGTVGVHPSLLPKYRGASPIQSVILNNEKETGTAIFMIDEKVDHGPIIAMDKISISPEDTYPALTEKLAYLSEELLKKNLQSWYDGKLKPEIQDDSLATFTKKFSTEDAEIDLKNDSPKQIWLKIKGLNPEPGAFTILKSKNGKALRVKLLEADYDGTNLLLKKVQPDGKKPMDWKSFQNGYKDFLQ